MLARVTMSHTHTNDVHDDNTRGELGHVNYPQMQMI